MSVVLSNVEEMVGRTVRWVSTGSQVINIGFDDDTCISIRLQEIEWNVQDHLRKINQREYEMKSIKENAED